MIHSVPHHNHHASFGITPDLSPDEFPMSHGPHRLTLERATEFHGKHLLCHAMPGGQYDRCFYALVGMKSRGCVVYLTRCLL